MAPYPMSVVYGNAFALGVEEELLLVDPLSHLLAHDAERMLAEVESLQPDLYLALIESATPITRGPFEAVAELGAARARARAAGATLLGAGIHPAGPFGEAPHIPNERYRAVSAQLRGLSDRTPTC